MLDKPETLNSAIELSKNPDLTKVFNEITLDRDVWAEASKNPTEFMRSRGIEIPKDFSIQLIGDPFMPTPDFELFTIHQFNCRYFWAKKIDGIGYELVEYCLGFEIVPHPIPGGPYGRS